MATLVFRDERFLDHATPDRHPERPDRYLYAHARLRNAGLLEGAPPAFGPATDEDLAAVHGPQVAALVATVCGHGGGYLESDTPVSPASGDVARLAAGAAVAAVDAVIGGQADTAFVLARPPGHHATPDRSMGFCLFNNVAVAARHAQRKHGVGRVLIVDWDVHHGNGTQDVFYADGSVTFLSLHRFPFYPGTGRREETGTGAGLGHTVNAPVAYGTDPATVRKTFSAALAQAVAASRPELVLLSAGFDAHRQDPIGDLGLDFEDFRLLGAEVLAAARAECGGRLVSLLEGGYNLAALSGCVEEHVRLLRGE